MLRTTLICIACAMTLMGRWATALAVGADDADQPGLVLTVQGLHGNEPDPGFPDSRISRLVALYVPAGAPPSSFAAPGRFKAIFSGDLNLRLRSYVRFSAEGRGKLTLSLNGTSVLAVEGDDWSKTVSNEVRLNKGKNGLVATYESPEAGDAAVRVFWSSKTFAPEPVPPMLLTHQVDAGLTRSLQAREGRALLGSFRCLKCHSFRPAGGPEIANAIPELAIDAPSLTELGSRLNRDWIAAWVADPHVIRRSARMPKIFADDRAGRNAMDVAAYLAGLTSDAPVTPSITGDPTNGGRLFANLDCIACHATPDSKQDPSRISLTYVKAKFKPQALRQYLLNPAAAYAWNPMPNFHLSEAESTDLTAYLLSLLAAKIQTAAAGDADNGKRLVTSSGCLNCHQLNGQSSIAAAPALDAIGKSSSSKGCLANSPAGRGAAPDFALTDAQRDSLAASLTTDRSSLSLTCAPEFAERQIVAMRCTTCHARDGNESLLAQSLEAESQALHQKYPNPPPGPGELLASEQRVPMLTWAGEKIRPDWMTRFIAGEIGYKPRYFLRARMPSFTARAALIAAGMAQEHGCPPALAPNPKPDPKLAAEGRKLCGKVPNVGFSCVQCHSVADTPPFAAFEAPSINLEYAAERLRHDYYLRWMHDPLRIDPATKMPRFDDAEAKTGLAAFGGDAKSQFEAVWQYLLEGPQIQPPQ